VQNLGLAERIIGKHQANNEEQCQNPQATISK